MIERPERAHLYRESDGRRDDRCKDYVARSFRHDAISVGATRSLAA